MAGAVAGGSAAFLGQGRVIGCWRPTPSPIGWRKRSRGLVERRRTRSQLLGLRFPGQGRDGDCSLDTGSTRGELEAAAATAAARRPDYPAGQLAVARGRCNQWAKRGAEAGREPDPPPGPFSVLGGLPGALLPSAHPAAACDPGAVGAPARGRPRAPVSPLWRKQGPVAGVRRGVEDRNAPGRPGMVGRGVFWWRIGRTTRVRQKGPQSV